MKNNEFFKAIEGSTEVTEGMRRAYDAWKEGMVRELDFPFLRDLAIDKAEVADFLTAIEQAGFKKFGYYGSWDCTERCVNFIESGWKVDGIFEFNLYFGGVFKGVMGKGLLFTKN